MRPFTFSNPSPVSNHSESVKSARKSGVSPENMDEGSVHFKAKPCPKNLFSQYFYYKMWEDEYFRNLKKKIRAEELLKISSLPPSMAKRARNSNKRSKDSLSVCSESKMGHKRKSKRVKSANKRPQSCTEFITTSTHPFKLRTDKRSSCRHTKSVVSNLKIIFNRLYNHSISRSDHYLLLILIRVVEAVCSLNHYIQSPDRI